MTEEIKTLLNDLINVLQEGFKSIEDGCQPSLEWEIDKLEMLKEQLGDS